MGWWVQLAWALFFTVVAELLRPKQRFDVPQPASLDEFELPTVDESRPVPVVFGTCKVSGPNVTWYGDLRVEAIRKKVKDGLWSSKRITVGYKYYLGAEFFICHGPVDNLLRIEFGDRIPVGSRVDTSDTVTFTYNDPDLFGGQEREGGVSGTVTFYRGTQTQTPNGYLQTTRGKALPAYRGFSYAVFQRVYLGTSAYIKPVAFVVERYPNTLGLTADRHKIGTDANPACMIYEILTNTTWGCGISGGQINVAGLRAVGDTLHTEGLGLSMLFNGTTTARNLLDEILRHVDGALYTDPQTGLIEVRLARADYTPAALPVFGPADISSLSASRISWEETKNTVKVTYTDQTQSFTARQVQVQDLANVQARGGTIDEETIQFLGFSNATNAVNAAARALKTLAYPLAKYTLRMNRKGWSLRPGSVFRLTWPPYGIEDVVVRVIAVDYGDGQSQQIAFEVVEDIFAVPNNAYTAPPPNGWTDPVTAPVPVAAQYAFEAPYQLIPEEKRYALVVAARSGAIDEGFDIYHDPAGGTAYTYSNTSLEFTPSGTLVSEYPATTAAVDATGFVLEAGTDLEFLANPSAADINAGNSLLLIRSAAGEEIVAWSTITDNGNGTFTVAGVYRGLLDTVPLTHAAGARAWFVSEGVSAVSEDGYQADGNVTGKLLPFNSRGKVTLPDAAQFTAALSQRASRPYPAGRLRVNSAALPVTVVGDATLTWAIRHRLEQAAAGVIVSQDAADYSVAPEGVFEVRVYVNEVLVDTSAPAILYPLPITNPNASDGMTGWTVVLGTFTTSDSSVISPQGGPYFDPGSSPGSEMQQTISLSASGVPEADIDNGSSVVQVAWLQCTYGQTPADKGQVVLTFLGASDNVLGTASSPLQAPSAPVNAHAWAAYSLEAPVPALTRSIRILARADRDSGTINDARFDGFNAAILAGLGGTQFIYSAQSRVNYSLDGTLPVRFGIVAINGAFSSVEHRTTPFVMTGLGMTLGEHLGGLAS